MVDLICSEDRCDLHDWGMSIDDEGGKRPKGRNPWRGMCLRIAALDRIALEETKKQFLENDLTDHYSRAPEFGEIPADLIREIVQSEIRKATIASGRTRKTKTGGTPL